MTSFNEDVLVKQLVKHEGVMLNIYQDSLGIDTIGIGRNVKDRGFSKFELRMIGKTVEEIYLAGITEEDAYFLLKVDIDIVARELFNVKPVTGDVDSIRQLVLMDMAFNMGVPRLCKFINMWAALEQHDYNKAADEMLDSKWAKQVKSRATNLAHSMQYGTYVN
jgi:lysozyme